MEENDIMLFEFPAIVHIWLWLSLLSGLFWLFLLVKVVKQLIGVNKTLANTQDENDVKDLTELEWHKLYIYISSCLNNATTPSKISVIIATAIFSSYMFFWPPDPIAPLSGMFAFGWVLGKLELISLYRKRLMIVSNAR